MVTVLLAVTTVPLASGNVTVRTVVGPAISTLLTVPFARIRLPMVVVAEAPNVIVALPMLTELLARKLLGSVDARLEIVKLVTVRLPTVVVVFPRPMLALPSVAVVAKLVSK